MPGGRWGLALALRLSGALRCVLALRCVVVLRCVLALCLSVVSVVLRC